MTSKRTSAERACPSCGAMVTPIPILYGMPVPSAFEDAEAGKIQLGGCVVTGEDPEWACPRCDEPILDTDEQRQRYQRAPEGDDWP